EGLTYTPDWREAVRAVDEGEAALAVLMRPTRIEDVFAVAKRGETMPQKSTYFYPKLLSGLLFHPLEPCPSAVRPGGSSRARTSSRSLRCGRGCTFAGMLLGTSRPFTFECPPRLCGSLLRV